MRVKTGVLIGVEMSMGQGVDCAWRAICYHVLAQALSL
ncbi:hypothetical protein MGWOODY_Clf2541 [hydrothermal vent metagenome]|uniref:Uncharacterized protein n=1 Tax=hydrothermal vent metagenome TaxID=652676 RepID=A0A160VAW7_9ZZZZ